MMMMMMHSGGTPRCMMHVSTLGIEQTRQPSIAKWYSIATLAAEWWYGSYGRIPSSRLSMEKRRAECNQYGLYLTSGRYRGTYCTLLSPTAAQAVRGRYLVGGRRSWSTLWALCLRQSISFDVSVFLSE